ANGKAYHQLLPRNLWTNKSKKSDIVLYQIIENGECKEFYFIEVKHLPI
ncbi:17711_t:CDS:1, partial [Funneliformis caledonium]